MSSEPVSELHLISRRSDERAWAVCRSRAEAGAHVEVVLIHDAVLETESTLSELLGEADPPAVTILACSEDAIRRKVEERWALIDYAGVIDHCARAARVTTW
ncbi:MAG TPA: hypothetical protein VI138_04855 [Candidatus Dormibacteraeota bacterium]